MRMLHTSKDFSLSRPLDAPLDSIYSGSHGKMEKGPYDNKTHRTMGRVQCKQMAKK